MLVLVRWDEMNVKVVTAPIAFSSSRPLRRIGISAYGYGGTVAHAVLESAKSIIPDYCSHKFMRPIKDTPNGSGYAEADADRPYLLLFSAHDRPTLKNNIDEYSTLCQDVNLLDFAYTLGLRRTKFQERAFAIVGGEIFNSSFEAASADIRTAPREAACPAFVFTGKALPLYPFTHHSHSLSSSNMQTRRYICTNMMLLRPRSPVAADGNDTFRYFSVSSPHDPPSRPALVYAFSSTFMENRRGLNGTRR